MVELNRRLWEEACRVSTIMCAEGVHAPTMVRLAWKAVFTVVISDLTWVRLCDSVTFPSLLY